MTPRGRHRRGGHASQDPEQRAEAGVEANARLTGGLAVVLLVLLAAEGLTILRVRALLTPHVFIGMLLIPPVLLKIGSTTYRFARYYFGAPAYRRKGPPVVLLRLLGPVVVLTTVAVIGTGVALLVGPSSERSNLLFLHKATFVLWFLAMVVHVLGHVLDTAKLAPKDWIRRSRRQVPGAGLRQWAIAGSVVLGIPLGLLLLDRVGPWLNASAFGH